MMESGRVRYLRQEEKQKTRPLYEAAFPEDSQEFIDYYYTWKTKENEIIVMEGAGTYSSFHVMVHLNPYDISICGNTRKLPYIVAVATAQDQRRQGKMGQVMQRALQDMERRGLPFTFLLPADPAYYRGQGFVFFPYQKSGCYSNGTFAQEITDQSERYAQEIMNWQFAAIQDAAGMASFADHILEKRYGIYIRRDACYYRRLLIELQTERGGAMLLQRKGEICGILLYSIEVTDGKRTVQVKELLLQHEISEEDAGNLCREIFDSAQIAGDNVKFTQSRMMARITSLFELVPLLRSDTPVSLTVKVKDFIINRNNGCFRIEINQRGGSIKRINEDEIERQMDISELAEELLKDISVCMNEWV